MNKYAVTLSGKLSISLTNKDKKILKSFVKEKHSSLLFRTNVDEEKKVF
jgi:hypothetical protein